MISVRGAIYYDDDVERMQRNAILYVPTFNGRNPRYYDIQRHDKGVERTQQYAFYMLHHSTAEIASIMIFNGRSRPYRRNVNYDIVTPTNR